MKFNHFVLAAVFKTLLLALAIDQVEVGKDQVQENLELNENFVAVSEVNVAVDSCIFRAESASDLKYSSTTYRKTCKQNIDENKYPHWSPILVNGRLQWKTYVANDTEAYNLIIKADCDHIMEGQVLHRYIGHGDLPESDKSELCTLFDQVGNNRSVRIKQILNGSTNMRFIDKQINISKGGLFAPPSSTNTTNKDLVTKEKANGFVTLLDDYVNRVTPNNFQIVVTDMDAVFAQFYVANKELIDTKYSFLAKRFINYANEALILFHSRTKNVIIAAGKAI